LAAERNRLILSVTDRGSILLIVYAAFSASVVAGLWQRVPVATLATLALIDAVLLAAAPADNDKRQSCYAI
jgi:sodium/bile acid cotransporter 7